MGQLSSAFRIDDEVIVRVPRHAYGVDRLRFEVGVLGSIRSTVDVAIPEIVDVSLDLPVGRSYVAHRLIPGRVLRRDDVSTMAAERVELVGHQIGRFLRDLHSVDPTSVAGVSILTASDFAAQLRAEAESDLGPIIGPAPLEDLHHALAALESVPDEPSVLAHTDIGGNVVIDEDGRVGIIDFGSCFVTHPAFDVASLSTLGRVLTDAAAEVHPLLSSCDREASAVAGTFVLQDALYGARQEDWSYVREVFGA